MTIRSVIQVKENKEDSSTYKVELKRPLDDRVHSRSEQSFEQFAASFKKPLPKRQFSLTDSPHRAKLRTIAGNDSVLARDESLKRKERDWDKSDDSRDPLPSEGLREVHVMPPTPRKKLKGGSTEPMTSSLDLAIKSFGTPLEFIIVDGSHDPIQRLQGMISRPLNGGLYKLPSGKLIPVIRQPIQEKPTCGPGCVLMLALRDVEKLVQNDNFWSWYGGTRLSNGESLVTAFRFLDIEAKVCRLTTDSANLSPNHDDDSSDLKLIDPNDAVATVKEAIDATKRPVILAITHPILKGHWIIVNDFHNGSALISDPYTGMAFALPEETLAKWLFEKESAQEMVYFTR